MASETYRYSSGAMAVKQVDILTPSTVEIGDIFTIIETDVDGVTQKSASFTATAATEANVTAGLTAAWNLVAGTLSGAVDNTSTIIITAKTAGIGFTITTATQDIGGAETQLLVKTASVPNFGPYDYENMYNWTTVGITMTNNINCHFLIFG